MSHQYRQPLPQLHSPQEAAEDYAWKSVESGVEFFQQKTEHRTARALSSSSQSSPEWYAEQVPQPVQTVDFMNSSNGPYYELPYTSRASSTLPSPSPMTPTTEDMFQQWAGRRRPSDFATSAAQSSFSPQSPRDYDLSTGNNLSSYMDGSYQTSTRANLFPEGFGPLPAAASYPGQGQLTLDLKSDSTMNGPPYPTHIIDHQGDGISQAFLDPHVLNTVPDGTFPVPMDANLLSMNYDDAEFETTPLDGIFQADQGPSQVEGYAQAHNQASSPQRQDQSEGTHERTHHTKKSTSLKTPTSHQGGQYRKSHQQQLHSGRSSQQIRATPRAHNPCPICHKAFESSTKLRKHNRKEHIRPYPCIFAHYGCNSVFGTKNEWSRHVKVQHLRLETWRCSIDDCEKSAREDDSPPQPRASKSKSEYDRKDLFLNHVRRCHKDRYPKPGAVEGPAASAYEEQEQQRCHLTLRSPPSQSLCPCCPGVVWPDFDARLEHIGRAMEASEEARAGFQDKLLEDYLLQEQLLCRDAGRWLLTGAEGKKGGRQAKRPAQRSLTTQTPLSSAVEDHEPPSSMHPSRKSKRVALKKQLLSRQVRQEENSEDDAEAEADEDYAI